MGISIRTSGFAQRLLGECFLVAPVGTANEPVTRKKPLYEIAFMVSDPGDPKGLEEGGEGGRDSGPDQEVRRCQTSEGDKVRVATQVESCEYIILA